MKELLTMWRRPRMVALTAFVALSYASLLIPFKQLTIIPGITTLRPAAALPVAFGLLFGPAAAWGCGIGNLLGDVLGGTLTLNSTFGFVGNVFFGFVSYKLWGNLDRIADGGPPTMRSGEQFTEYVVVVVVAASGTGAIIGWGAETLALVPFSVLSIFISVNIVFAATILGPPLLFFLYPRVREAGLLYPQLMPAAAETDGRWPLAPAVLVAVPVGWLLAGVLISLLVHGVPLGASPAQPAGEGGSTLQIGIGTVAFAILVLAGATAPGGPTQTEPSRE